MSQGGIRGAIEEFQALGEVAIKITGNGGQGVILTGYILGRAAMLAGTYAIQTQTYGAAARGTKVTTDLIINRNAPVNYPVVKKMHLLVALTQHTFDSYRHNVVPGGLILVDQDMVPAPRADRPVLALPAAKLAKDNLGHKIVTNIVMLGAIFHVLGFLSPETGVDAITGGVPPRFRALNSRAFQLGLEKAGELFQ